MSVRTCVWLIAAVCGVAQGQDREGERGAIELEIPLRSTSIENAAADAIALMAESCDEPGTAPYLIRLFAGPVMHSIEDSLTVRYRCIERGDPRLDEPGRDATRRNAGQGLLEVASRTDTRGPFGWDMTYSKAFDAAAVPRNDTMRKMYRDAWVGAPYVKRSGFDLQLLEGLEQATSTVLLDYQLALPVYGGRMIGVFSATASKAEIRGVNRRGDVETQPADSESIRRLAHSLMTYEPEKPEQPPQPYSAPGVSPDVFVNSGYIGVVSVSLDGRSRQFLITEADVTSRRGDRRESGPLMRAMELAMLPPQQQAAKIEADSKRRSAQAMIDAATQGDLTELARLIDSGLSINSEAQWMTPLMAAVRARQLHAVKFLLERGADPEFRIPSDGAPLLEAAKIGAVEAARLLIDAGANIEQTEWRQSVLQVAVQNQQYEFARYLVSRGADVNARLRERTALMAVVSSPGREDHLDAVRFLLSIGADTDLIDAKCNTALSLAKQRRRAEVERILLEHGADPTLSQKCEAARHATRQDLRKADAEMNAKSADRD